MVLRSNWIWNVLEYLHCFLNDLFLFHIISMLLYFDDNVVKYTSSCTTYMFFFNNLCHRNVSWHSYKQCSSYAAIVRRKLSNILTNIMGTPLCTTEPQPPPPPPPTKKMKMSWVCQVIDIMHSLFLINRKSKLNLSRHLGRLTKPTHVKSSNWFIHNWTSPHMHFSHQPHSPNDLT